MQSKPQDDSQSTGKIAIKLLGGFAANRGDEAVAASAWRLRKGRELVKLLALAPHHRLHREQLMDALWPDLDPAAAANNLHQVVHAARRALGPEAIELREELLTLRAGVDVEDFERAAEEARRAGSAGAARAAMSLYGGELLPENRYDDWTRSRREEVEELRAELEAEIGGADGDRAAGLPAQASSFVGRSHELRELLALVGRARLLTLAGAGGAGKTRLALELAREVERSYAHGSAFVELASLGDGRLVAPAVAAALDVGALPGRSSLEEITDFLQPRRLLLVLDNCEHVLLAAAELADTLLRAAPDVTILATSREPLRVAGEVVFRVPSMAIPDPGQPLTPEELLRYEAVQLLIDRAAAAVPEFAVDAENAGDIARICFRLDGLPLALELAAARIGALGTATLAERLDDSFRLLRSGSRVGPTRQQTLAATLQWSHDLLDSEEKLLLRRLAIFAGGFDLAATETVCAGDGLELAAVADVLARLVEKSLVTAEHLGRGRRYHLLETVRLYAAEQLEQAGERGSLADRHARWALTIAEREADSPGLDREAANLRTAHDALLARDPEQALRYCVALLAFWMRRIDLREGHQRLSDSLEAASERTPLRAAGLLAMSAIDFRSGDLACGAGHAQESLEIANELEDPQAEWRALQRLGEIAVGYDDAPTALRVLGSARALATREGLDASEAVSAYSLGVARWLLGDLAGAEADLVESVASFRRLAGTSQRILSPLNIAEMRSADPSGQQGLRIVFEETLLPLVEISCDTAIGYVLANQATIARVRGELGRARELLDEADARLANVEDQRGQADVLVRRAYLELAEGSCDGARACLERALHLRQGMRDRRGVGMVLMALGIVETIAGRYEPAEQPLAEARRLFRRAGDRWGLASALWRTADLAIAQARLDDAEATLQEARAVVGETERQRWIGVTVATLAEVVRLRGDPQLSRTLFEQAREHYLAGGAQDGAEAIDGRLQSLAKDRQRPRKVAAGRNAGTATTKRRQS
ncbi:MAG TPA: AAA family ATPase [Solirubrobacteraceae bacterium]|nr:AAA family ATPase [Solirubrobacteraceae bacterium]